MDTSLISLFTALCALQLGGPFLAFKIKRRFHELGIPMSSRPGLAMFSLSTFWSEARRLNKTPADPMVRNLIFVYQAWWVAAIIVFALLFFEPFIGSSEENLPLGSD